MPLVLPAIVAAIIAILGLLVYYGAEKLAQIFTAFTPSIGIGKWNLKNLVETVGNVAVGIIRDIVMAIVHPVEQFFEAIAAWIVRIIGDAVNLGHWLGVAIWRVVSVHIPALVRSIEHYAQVLVTAAAAELGARIGQLRADVHGWLDDLRGWVTTLVGAAVAALSDRLHQLRADVFGALSDLTNWTRALVAGAVATLGHEIAQLRDWTIARVAGVEHDLTQAVAGVERDIAGALSTAEGLAGRLAAAAERDAINAVDTTAVAAAGLFDGLIIDTIPNLEAVLATDFPDIGAAIRAIPRAIPTDLTGVLAITGALALANVRYLEQCGIPNCRNLSKIGRDLQELFSVLEGAGFLALLAFLVSDPKAAAQEIESVLGPVVSGTADAARSLLGVG